MKAQLTALLLALLAPLPALGIDAYTGVGDLAPA